MNGGMVSLGYDPLLGPTSQAPNQSIQQVAADPAYSGSNPSLLEQANAGIQQATSNFVPLSIPGVNTAGTAQPIIQGLPGDISSYVKKYQTNLPLLQQAVAAGTITPEAVNAVQSYDASRVVRGQAPLNAKETAGALQTVSTGQQATPEPSHSAWDVFGNAHRDLATIVGSVPHLIDPRTYINEAKQLPHIPQDIAAADNPIAGLFQAPGVRLIPGAFTLGNLAEGRKGIETALTHPLMTALDVMAVNHGIGRGLASPEELAEAKINGEHVPGGIGRGMQAAGIQEPYDNFKAQMKEAILNTKGGQWLDATFGERGRALGLLVNRAASQARDALNPAMNTGTSLIDPNQVITQITRPIMQYAKAYAEDISPQRMADLTDMMQHDPATIPDLTDRERAFLTDTRSAVDSVANYHIANGELEQRVVNGTMEVYKPSEAATLDKAWAARNRYEAFTLVRQAVRNPDLLTADHLPILAEKVQGIMNDDSVPGTTKARLARGYGYAVRNIDGTLPTGYAKAIANRDWYSVSAALDNHAPTFDLPVTNRETTLAKQWETLTRKYTPARMSNAFKIAGKVEDEVLPARWRELSDQLVKGKVTDQLAAYGASSKLDVSEVIGQAQQQNYARVADAGLLTADDMKRFREEAAATIGEIRRTTGTDPIFVHRIEPEQVASIQYGANPAQGTLQGNVKTPSQLRDTPDNAKPYVHNVTVAVSHEAQQVVNSAAQRYIYSELLRTDPAEGETTAPFARRYVDLQKQYEGVLTGRQSINPQITDLGVIDKAIKRGWAKFPIERLPSDLKVSLGLADEMGENHPYIPRSVLTNLEKLDHPSYYPVLDPIMKVFRTALLPLSPRFLFYHMIGGAIQLAGQTDPLTVWKYLGDARDMVARYEGGADDQAAVDAAKVGETPRVGRTFPDTMRPVLGHIMDPQLEWEWQSGGTIRRLMGDRFGPESTATNIVGGAADKARETTAAIVKKSYSLTTFFQDTYRAMGYLYGYDKGLTAGMTEEQAVAAGETLARKTLMTWDDMTAVERTGMRAIFPFYGFARHILTYAAQYPIDHPFRAAVISSIARNEANDLGTGLPSTMLNMLMLGHPDKHGHVEALMGGALNPFRDVANMTTLAGWLSATNPIISGVLQSAGLDTSSGGPDLYPNLQYDPDTGRLAAQSTNPLLNILTQSVPQSQLLLGMLSKSSEYHDLMRTNPASAMRLIASQAGIPLAVEDQNIAGQQIKGEVTRETAASTAYDNALKTGDYREAMKWPTVAPVLRQVQALKQSGALTQFMPGGANSQQKLDQIAQLIGQVGQ